MGPILRSILHVEEAVGIEIGHVQNQYHNMVETIVVAMIQMFRHVTIIHVLVRCSEYSSPVFLYRRPPPHVESQSFHEVHELHIPSTEMYVVYMILLVKLYEIKVCVLLSTVVELIVFKSCLEVTIIHILVLFFQNVYIPINDSKL
jgi:hypothetical protein